ncbi:MAG TPA: hypothetical protein VNN10_01805 [Dehalococcoidia bacterium]|nr:hypothetical protein [Dehalococcoidia bacterium]
MPDTLAVLHIAHTARGAAEVALTIAGAGLSLGGLLLGALALAGRRKRPRGGGFGADPSRAHRHEG